MPTLDHMPPEEAEKLVAELEAWCGAEHGRRAEVAKALGVSRQYVTNVLARRRSLTLKHYFALQEFLRKQRK
jgi:antitoxin component HigA of HigAB toxin-antitoxin module